MNKQFIFKSLQVFMVRGFGAAAAFFLTLAVTNTTSSEQSGLFLFCLAVINVIATIMLVGSQQSIVRFVGSNCDANWLKINCLFSIVVKIVSLLCLLNILLFLFFSDFIAIYIFRKPALAPLLLLASLSVFLLAGVQVFSSAIQGKQQGVLASLIQNVIMPLCFIIGITISFYLFNPISAQFLLIIYAVSLSFAFFVGVFYWYNDSRSVLLFKKGFPKELRDSMCPLFIVSSMTLCVQWAGQFAAARYLDSHQIAYFASAHRTALLAGFVLIAVNLVVAPKFAYAFSKGLQADVRSLSLTSSKLMIVMASPVLLVMLLFPESLMRLFGDEYVIAAPLLQIMAVGQFINVVTGSVAYLLTMTNHEKDFRNVVLFSGPLAIVLAFYLTKEFGLIGAAYATAISVATQNLLAVYMVKKRLGFNTLNLFRKY